MTRCRLRLQGHSGNSLCMGHMQDHAETHGQAWGRIRKGRGGRDKWVKVFGMTRSLGKGCSREKSNEGSKITDILSI